MKYVYVTEQFCDYEGGKVEKVFAKEKDAKEWCRKEAEKEKSLEKYVEPRKITKLPHGFKYRDEGWIYTKLEVKE